ncbi:sensor histidine kinase [Streptomyces carpaticus]|uniref:histidine kinase n=1 Tax=Streptomyces carpaticus TaxID=285558 RepID=A0ABV4ZU62_9ACTN
MRGSTVVRVLLGAGLGTAALVTLPAAGPLITLPAALAGCAALLAPAHRWAAPAVAVLSLAATAGYPGPAGNAAGPWWLAESAALLALLVPAARYGRLRAVPAVLALAVLPLRVGPRLEPPSPPDEMAVVCLLALLAAGTAVAAGRYLRTLDARRARAVRDARRAQRIALARDLHDFVAHEVSGMLVQAQAARFVAAAEPAQAIAALERIETAGRRAMQTLDETVRMLDEDGARPGDRSALAELTDTVRRFPGAVLESDPAVAEVPESAHRLVAEALTNVRRHAPGAPAVTVAVRRTADGLLVRVSNTAPAGTTNPAATTATAAFPGGGTGLAVLRRRLAAEGATLTAGPLDGGGWHTTARWDGAT